MIFNGTWSFYDAQTGALSGRRFSGPARMLKANTPEGHVAIEGKLDRLSQRVDVATGNIVDYVPPQPDERHEWHAQSKRWRKRADVVLREAADRRARKRIAELERAQLRPLRELAVDANNAEAKRRLAEIDAEIAGLRNDLVGLDQPAG
jgi:hypothetical protein